MTLKARVLEQLELLPYTNAELAKKLRAHPASVRVITLELLKAGVVRRQLSYNWTDRVSKPWVYSTHYQATLEGPVWLKDIYDSVTAE